MDVDSLVRAVSGKGGAEVVVPTSLSASRARVRIVEGSATSPRQCRLVDSDENQAWKCFPSKERGDSTRVSSFNEEHPGWIKCNLDTGASVGDSCRTAW